MRKKIIIMGAAGKDFHAFNTCYRDRQEFEVVAFTAAQIPNIDNRRYPAALAGRLYPDGIPIKPEAELVDLIRKHQVKEVIFAYSDVSYESISQREQLAHRAGAEFNLAEVDRCMLRARKPVVAVCAVRTGCGKSQTTRRVAEIFKKRGKTVVACRHPMPYGDLVRQRVQRFASLEDMDKQQCTIEEREEYEFHVLQGNVVYAGVDYAEILEQAQSEADVVLWDGGNNDIPFFKPNLHITIVDPFRPGHEILYYPGKINLELADVIVINKMDSAPPENVEIVLENIRRMNGKAIVVKANSRIDVSDPELVRGKRVLCIEDGPTVTHGDMKLGAGVVAARRLGGELVDPRPWLKGTLQGTFRTYPNIGSLLPAMGYGDQQISDLEATVNACECDAVIVATPINLGRIIRINKPLVRVTYSLDEIGEPNLEQILAQRIQ